MFQNYIKIAVRKLIKQKGYSFINITGLALGIACCVLIFLYVQNELSYDRFHENADRTYRVILEFTENDEPYEQIATPSIIAPLFQREFPEVDQTVRIYPPWRASIIRHEDRVFNERAFYFADSSFLNIFTYELALGNPQQALNRPNTVILTQQMAKKYFGDDNPLGKTIIRNQTQTFEVTGVLKDVPKNSHMQFDFIASYYSLTNSWAKEEVWHSANLKTYVMLDNENLRQELLAKLPTMIEREMVEKLKSNESMKILLKPITEIHLYSNTSIPGELNGNIIYVYAFSAIGLLILLIACINYMNLSTARSSKRGREVGIRKALGAYRNQLSWQFLGEAVLMTVLALLLAVLIINLFLPLINTLTGRELETDYFGNPVLSLSLILAGFFVSLVAGSYPAFFLSAFQPIEILKTGVKGKAALGALRNRFVIFQFVISIGLILLTTVVYNQLQFVKNRNLGFSREQVVILPVSDHELKQSRNLIKAELLQYRDILAVSAVDGYPSNQRAGYLAAGEGLAPDQYPLSGGMSVDNDIVKTLGLQLIAGSGFPPNYTPEKGYYYLINEALLMRLGWQADEAIGKWLNLLGNRQGMVAGVVKDYNFASLHSEIEPLAMFTSPRDYDYSFLLVKIGPHNISNTLDFIEQKWQKLAPNRPFEFSFLDQEFNALYQSEERLGQTFLTFSGLAILIACLGLFGLAAFVTEQRTKEIGVRKVLGASVTSVVMLLVTNFIKLVLLANIIAWPVAWFIMNNWLQNFAYRIEIGWWVFALAGGVALSIALLTVGFLAVRAALSNPIKALRYE